MFKKNLAVATALTLTIGLLSGCGNTEDYENAVSGSNKTEESVASTEGAEDETTAPTSNIEVVDTDESVTDLSELPVEDYLEMGEYTGLEVSVTALVVPTEEEVADYAEQAFVGMATSMKIMDTEGTVDTGDVVIMDYSGKLDDVAFEGGTATDASLEIGSGNFIPGFEDGLIGTEVGETVDLTLSFPEEYPNNPDLAGQETVFTVTVHGIVSDMTDETVARLEGFEFTTVDEYYAFVEDYMNNMNLQNYEMELDNNLVGALAEKFTVNQVPDLLYQMQYDTMIASLESEAAMYGMKAEEYAPLMYGSEADELCNAIALEYAAQIVMFQAIANQEEIAITEEEVDEFVTSYMTSQAIATEEELYEAISRSEIKIYLMQEKVMTLLLESAVITEV